MWDIVIYQWRFRITGRGELLTLFVYRLINAHEDSSSRPDTISSCLDPEIYLFIISGLPPGENSSDTSLCWLNSGHIILFFSEQSDKVLCQPSLAFVAAIDHLIFIEVSSPFWKLHNVWKWYSVLIW